MEKKDEWIKELERRQDNIDPIRRIRIGALFQGTLIKGDRRLNGWLRAGALVIGMFALTFGCFGLADIIAALRSWSLVNSDLYISVFCPFSLWLGWKVTMNALFNSPQNSAPHKKQ